MKRPILVTLGCLAVLFGIRSGLWAQRSLRNIPDPDPEVERKSLRVAEGWEVNLFASDPMIANPIHMNWDAQGRLWVACSPIYPHILPGQTASDQIIVLEDTDQDGRADKRTVFTSDLLIPTAVLPGDGGAYVANSTEVLFLKDTDGDGRADYTRVMLSGFGTEDTHHIIHTFLFGPDGMMYFNQSIYIHSHVETPWGVRRLGGGGTWQFRPETIQLEVFVRGFVNPWGHRFDRWGQSFFTDGAYGEGINYGFPGAVYVTAPGAKRIIRGLNPGQPKHCSMEIVSGRHVPEDWVGSIITNDFRGNRVQRFVISEDGSGYASRQAPDVITSKHVAFRPIDVKMGPDGAIYVADWYNPIIQHGEVSFRDARRDHKHGRVWRLTYKGRPLVPRPQLKTARIPALLAALKLPEDAARVHAKLMLKERGAAVVVPHLEKWLAALKPSDPQYEHDRLEALWAYQSINVVAADLLRGVLGSRDHRARAAAVRVLGQWRGRISDTLALLEKAVGDEHPRVRLEAVNALRLVGTAPAAELALRALDKKMDGNLDFALWLTVRELRPIWLPAFAEGRVTLGGKLEHVLFALKSTGDSAVLQPLVSLLRRGVIQKERRQDVLRTIAELGGPAELRLVLDYAASAALDADPARRAQILASLAEATRRRGVRPGGDLGRVREWLRGTPRESTRTAVEVQIAAAHLAGAWKLDAARPELVARLEDAASPLTLVEAATGALARIGTDPAKRDLDALAARSAAWRTRVLAAAALVHADVKRGCVSAVGVLTSAPADADVGPIFQAVLRRRDGPKAFADAVGGKTIRRQFALVGVNATESTGLQLADFISALRVAGRLEPMKKALTQPELEQLLREVTERGDVARGEVVFRRQTLGCMACHAIAGAGGQVGPDLISLGASAPMDYIVESILEPNKKIKEGYHMIEVLTKTFQVYAGTMVRETDGGVVLREATGREVEIAKKNIAKKKIQNRSMMPSGLVSLLPRTEFVDLVAFLSALGKDLVVPRTRLVRSWRYLAEAGGFDSVSEVLENEATVVWSGAYSTVAGELPLEAVPASLSIDSEKQRLLKFGLEVTTPGNVALRISRPETVILWVAGKPVAVKKTTKLWLGSGIHDLVLSLGSGAASTLRVELVDVEGSPAKVRLSR